MASDELAGPALSQRSTRERLRERLTPIALGLLAALLAFERLPRGTRRTLWAEDGPLFLGEALRGEYNLFAVYAGYLHVLPRAASLFVVNVVDVRLYATAINMSACLFTGLVAAVVYIGAEDVVPNKLLRGWLSLWTVLLPLLGVEVLANLANLHSVMMWGAFWALLRHPRTLAGAIGLACFALFAALTEVQAAFLMPMALLLLWREPTLRRSLVVAGCTLGVAAQMFAAWTHESVRQPHLLEPSIVLQLLGIEVAMPFWLVSTEGVRTALETHGWWLPGVAALPLVVGAALAFRYGDAAQRFAAIAALGLGLFVFCASHMMNGVVMGGPGYSVLRNAPVLQRYAVVPSLLFVATLGIGTAAAWQRERRAAGWLGVSSIGALLIASLAHFRVVESSRDPLTSWTRQLRQARVQCESGAQDYSFLISPDSWTVIVPCSRVRIH
jgi:hypothetical protein